MLKCANSTRTEPAKEPILLDELKEQLRIDHTDLDPELQHLITEARKWAEENELHRLLITQTVTEKFNAFDVLKLRWPAQSITSIVYLDTNGSQQTLSTDYYELGNHLGVSVVRLKYNQSWPSTRDHEDVVTVVYVAGYGDERNDVPLPIRQAVKAYAAYRHDGMVDAALLAVARNLLGPYSVKE